MSSRQFEHLHEQSLQRLKDMIPPRCPLYVARHRDGFRVYPLDESTDCVGRYQIAATYISGFVDAWKRTRPPSEPHLVGEP